MAYVINRNKAAAPPGDGVQPINGYRVRFFQDGRWQSRRFKQVGSALGFQRGLRFGAQSEVVPIKKK